MHSTLCFMTYDVKPFKALRGVQGCRFAGFKAPSARSRFKVQGWRFARYLLSVISFSVFPDNY